MGSSTNGFNYSSDYQGHTGSNIVILFVILLGVFIIGTYKNGGSTKTYNYNSNEINNDNNVDDSSSVLDENDNDIINHEVEGNSSSKSSSGAIFQLYE